MQEMHTHAGIEVGIAQVQRRRDREKDNNLKVQWESAREGDGRWRDAAREMSRDGKRDAHGQRPQVVACQGMLEGHSPRICWPPSERPLCTHALVAHASRTGCYWVRSLPFCPFARLPLYLVGLVSCALLNGQWDNGSRRICHIRANRAGYIP